MTNKKFLILEDGTVFDGYSFGYNSETHGEIVFNTSMTGYQEVLTDPSYAGQIGTMTYPMIGNYGINLRDNESGHIQVSGFLIRELCETPSHSLSVQTLNNFMKDQSIPGIFGVDTRSIARKIRNVGVMRGVITSSNDIASANAILDKEETYEFTNYVESVSTKKMITAASNNTPQDMRVVITDCGVKNNIIRMLNERNCEVISVPFDTPSDDILKLKPDGVLVSPGPGDPKLLRNIGDNTKKMIGKVPMLGICLGHQIIAESLGAKTYKLKFGHRGANHPVKDLITGRVYVTAQNHGYAVDSDTLPKGLEVSHLNLNDNTVEGLIHKEYPVFSIQYHSEASPGPKDNEYIFDQFVSMIQDQKKVR